MAVARTRPLTGLLRPPGDLIAPVADRFKWLSDKGALRLIALGAAVVVFGLPFFDASAYTMTILASAFIFVMMALGLNVVVGYTGLLDLGYIAFYAVGAYTSGILTTRLGWSQVSAIPVVIVICILAGIIIGGPTLRLRSDYLAIVTLGFGEIIRITANNLTVTGGPSGIYGIPGWEFFGWKLRDGFSLGGLHFDGRVTFYYFVAIIVILLGIVGLSQISRGKMGRAWRAVRDDEDAAEAMGINTYQAKITAYIIGAVWAGLAGQLTATQLSAISPNSFQFLNSALVLMAVVLGGMGSTPGVIIGALFISLAPELLRGVADWRYVIFGVLLIAVMIFRPAGLWPSTSVLPWSRDSHLKVVDPVVAGTAVIVPAATGAAGVDSVAADPRGDEAPAAGPPPSPPGDDPVPAAPATGTEVAE